jgi:uncharacterized RDD family membrane protein YckC
MVIAGYSTIFQSELPKLIKEIHPFLKSWIVEFNLLDLSKPNLITMHQTFAGFWLRFVAYIIDTVIIYALQSFIFVPVFGLLGISFASRAEQFENMSDAEAVGAIGAMAALSSAAIFLSGVIALLYWTIMESSKYQATIGKLALGLKVTDMDGNSLDFVKALVRNLCKILSGMIMGIGYIIAGFTEKKQGLHDIIANTLVVKK